MASSLPPALAQCVALRGRLQRVQDDVQRNKFIERTRSREQLDVEAAALGTLL